MHHGCVINGRLGIWHRNYRRETSQCGRSRSGLHTLSFIVSRLPKVTMQIDQSRRYKAVGRIKYVSLSLKINSHGDDPPITANRNVTSSHPERIHDRATLD